MSEQNLTFGQTYNLQIPVYNTPNSPTSPLPITCTNKKVIPTMESDEKKGLTVTGNIQNLPGNNTKPNE